MKKGIVLCVVLMFLATPSFAFLYDMKFLTPSEIGALKSADLLDLYTEAKIEEKASSEFHEAAGFNSAKDYEKRKDLLRYIVYLRKEMQKREIEPDPVDEWLR